MVPTGAFIRNTVEGTNQVIEVFNHLFSNSCVSIHPSPRNVVFSLFHDGVKFTHEIPDSAEHPIHEETPGHRVVCNVPDNLVVPVHTIFRGCCEEPVRLFTTQEGKETGVLRARNNINHGFMNLVPSKPRVSTETVLAFTQFHVHTLWFVVDF